MREGFYLRFNALTGMRMFPMGEVIGPDGRDLWRFQCPYGHEDVSNRVYPQGYARDGCWVSMPLRA